MRAIVIVVLLLPVGVGAAEPPALSDIAWMSGSWNGTALGGRAEEHWSVPLAGTMVGMFRLEGKGQTRVLEFLVIEEKDGVVTYRFKHFKPDYQSWEDEPLDFTLVEATEGRAVFRGAEEQSPSALIYQLEGDRLTITVEGSGQDGAESFDVPLRRRESLLTDWE